MRRIVFSCTKERERTDHEFRNYVDRAHHKAKTILTENPFVSDMIHSFPIDVMHCLDLGVMKKIFAIFDFHKLLDKDIADAFINTMKKYVPSDFVRRPRGLKHMEHFKATEYRLFALYLAPVLFKLCKLNTNQYTNFLNFFISYRLIMGLNGEVTEDECRTAEILLRQFVKTFHDVFDELSFNFHNILHLVDVVRRHGPVDKYSAYKYENFYFLMRKWIRKPSHIFEQLWNRWTQTRGRVQRKSTTNKTFGVKILDSSIRNNCIMTEDDNIYIITKKIVNPDGVFFETKKFSNRSSFFSTPVISEDLNIYVVSDSDLVDGPALRLEQVKRKMFRIPYLDQFVIMPVLHY